MDEHRRFHALRWISTNQATVAGQDVEEFIDTTRTYSKTIWSDGYTEITEISAVRTGETIKEINKKLVVNKLVTKYSYFC